jgi:uncharacterized protein (TIGR02757 family)
MRKEKLDQLYNTYDDTYLFSDPLQLVKRFKEPRDQEIAAVVISSLAFGQVSQITKAGEFLLTLMHYQPRKFIESFDPEIEIKRWKKFYYRMVKSSDVLRLCFALKLILEKYGSLGDWVFSKFDRRDEHLGIAWARCVDEIKAVDQARWTWKRSRGIGFNHLLPNPTNQSACKRSNLLLRWMVRKDKVDCGIWSFLPASKLTIPLDTHVQRISYNIGLTDRRDVSWKTAAEITMNLRKLDPADPVKYDFAICRLGILKMCPRKRDLDKCAQCPIYEICRL